MPHIVGRSRDQWTALPPTLDELVPEHHPIRVIDAFVDAQDLAGLGFEKAVAEATGRPPYQPGDLLKLYIYGYLQQVRSSRRLEREAKRNIEVMWLIGSLTPSFKTIADFRKDHPDAIVKVCRAFVQFCRGQSLIKGDLVAIDGTKIGAVASRKKVITPAKIAKATAAIDRQIAEHLAAMDAADAQEPAPGDGPTPAQVAAAVEALRRDREELQRQAKELSDQKLKQLVTTEPDAKLMRTAHHGYQVAYNAQIAVDAESHLITAFDLTNEGNDQQQLFPMAVQAKEELGSDKLSVVADTGYSNGGHGALCESAGITAAVPRAETVNPEGEQYFTRDKFSYDAASDTWQCPAGRTLSCRKNSQTDKKKEYWCDECGDCPLKAQCTKAAKRVIVRSYFEDDRQAMHQRAVADPELMRTRRCVVEHPFGTMKWMMGTPRFLVRSLKKAKSELGLTVLGYNLKAAIARLGVPEMLNALRPTPL